jgi:hypothetical protein
MRRGVRIPDWSEITADTPLSLDVAARIASAKQRASAHV